MTVLESIRVALDSGQVRKAGSDQRVVDAARECDSAVSDQLAAIDALTVWAPAAVLAFSGLDAQGRARLDGTLRILLEQAQAIKAAKSLPELAAAKNHLTNMVRELTRLSEGLAVAWEQHVKTRFDAWEKLGKLLASFPQAKDLGAELQAVAKRGLALRRANDIDADTPRRFGECHAQLLELEAKLEGTGVRDDVAAFLRKAVEKSATLDLVTPAVREWLGDGASAFRVSLRHD